MNENIFDEIIPANSEIPAQITQPKKDLFFETKTRLFLEYLEECGNVSEAAKNADVGRKTVYTWRDEDEDFKNKWDAALNLGCDGLEDEATRRAFRGVERPVFQGGERVGSVTDFSDTLLIFLLKGRRPEKFKERGEQSLKHGGDPNGIPIGVNHTGEVTVTSRWADLENSFVNAANRSEEGTIPSDDNGKPLDPRPN